MDTPLVKILLIAAAIAITVGVIVLAWGIFNSATAEVETDAQASAQVGGTDDNRTIGTRADVLRARITNERACRAAGYRWFNVDEGVETASTGLIRKDAVSDRRGYQRLLNGGLHSSRHRLADNPGTQVNERESHCAVATDTYSDDEGLEPTIWLFSTNDNDQGTSPDYRPFRVHFPT